MAIELKNKRSFKESQAELKNSQQNTDNTIELLNNIVIALAMNNINIDLTSVMSMNLKGGDN